MRQFVFPSTCVVLLLTLLPYVCCEDPIFTNVPNCRANRMYFPICASNGKNYANRDIFNCANATEGPLTIIREGEVCREEDMVLGRKMKIEEGEEEDENKFENEDDGCKAPKVYNPVCASNGQSYLNEALFMCAKEKDSSLEILHRGHCNEKLREDKKFTINAKCVGMHPKVFSPICAYDGNNRSSFISETVLMCINDLEEEKLKLVGYSHCNDVFPSEPSDESDHVMRLTVYSEYSNCVANFMYDPVCGSDGKTYPNKDLFNCANKEAGGRLFIADDSTCDLKVVRAMELSLSEGISPHANHFFVSVLVLCVLFLR